MRSGLVQEALASQKRGPIFTYVFIVSFSKSDLGMERRLSHLCWPRMGVKPGEQEDREVEGEPSPEQGL